MGSNALSATRPAPRDTRHIGDAFPTLDQVLAAAEAARTMVEGAGWPILLTLLDSEIATIDRELDGRLLDSRAAYARALGRRDGLRAAPALIEALLHRAESRIEEQRRKHEDGAETPLEVA